MQWLTMMVSPRDIHIKAPFFKRERRVKKICRWHIFSQSGEQAVLATWVVGWLGEAKTEGFVQAVFLNM